MDIMGRGGWVERVEGYGYKYDKICKKNGIFRMNDL